ncbi:MAG: class I SAM-dependent methyltransferase [Candidatus Binataceae bacterium]
MAHKETVQEEFTRQAEAFAASPTIKDPDRIRRLVDAVAPATSDRVLELATGPGHVALAFAARCRDVVGVDLTAAPLEIAERMRAERGISNARFMRADVESRLPFGDGEFAAAVCRLSFHHFENPAGVAAEMARVCKAGGKVAVEDIVASEHPERAAYHNEFERLRDTSHTRFLPLCELISAIAKAGCDIVSVAAEDVPNPVNRWLATAQTPPDRAARALAMIERDLKEDRSGTNPRKIGGELFFTHRMVTIVARKLDPRPA